MFKEVLGACDPLLEIESKTPFLHKGLRGDSRATALRTLFESHLPDQFKIGQGEVLDSLDNRSGEIDLFIYDSATAAPLKTYSEDMLIPAESLYMVIEVKSVLTQDELDKSVMSAKLVRKLRPFKEQFAGTPINGAAQPDRCRCPYMLFAFDSNLGVNDWPQKEYDRLKKSIAAAGGKADLIDRIIVLKRGVIRPQTAEVWISEEEVFLEFYVHVMNFLMREKGRRPPIDWAAYAPRRRWNKLTP